MNYFFRFLPFVVFFASCTSPKSLTLTNTSRLAFLGEYDIPFNQEFKNTTIGGLSGIDYDNKQKIYYLISDDRSAINPSRFYTAKISLSEKRIDTVQFLSTTPFLQPNGTTYPNSKQDPYHTPDPEAIRYNPRTNQLVWSSEGERIVRKDAVVLEDPSVATISLTGRYIDSFVLPSNMHMQSIEKGPRQNEVFEGITFNRNYKKFLVNVEGPLYEDGPRPGLNDTSGWIRIIRFDTKTRKPEGQYAYKIDPVAHPANPPGAFKINGVPDILAVNDHQLLVIERSYSMGRKPCTIKLYLADLDGASDVSGLTSLTTASFVPLSKKLLLNMDDLGIFIDNIEGVTLGPKLANGHQSLIFVSDNNFSKEQLTQFLFFELQ